MMKKISLAILIVVAAATVQAQAFMLGVKGGINYSQATILNVIGVDGVDMDDVESQAGFGIVVGGFARIGAGRIFIQPELLFSETQSLVRLDDIDVESTDLGDLLSMDVDKVDVPVLLGYHLGNKFRLMAGPVFSNIRQNTSDPLFDFDNITTGYQLGFGLDMEKLLFDVRYEGNLEKVSEFIETDGGIIEVDTRRNIFQFTLGYKLF